MAMDRLRLDDIRRSGFPIYSLTRDEKRMHLRSLLSFDRSHVIEDGIVRQRGMHGLALAWHYQPHAWGVRCGDMLTPLEVFRSDELRRSAITRWEKQYGPCTTQSKLRKALRTFSGTQSVSNFRPTAAAAIFDRYLPVEGAAVWDMSAGFGGRLLGALACRKVRLYIGTDPATLTMDGLCEMRDELAPMVQSLGHRVPDIKLHRVGSEEFIPEPESMSLCFTSTPYGKHERYSDEPTQSYVKFPTNDEWLHGYMRQTLDNCHIGLKPDGFLVVNIAGVKSYPTLQDDLVALALVNGWELIETLSLALSRMPGTRRQGTSHKHEPIYVFRKGFAASR
jgi:hypothetical protein